MNETHKYRTLFSARRMPVWCAAAGLAASIPLLTGCQARGRHTVIGVAYESLNSEFWMASRNALEAELGKRNTTMLEAIADADANRQFEQVRNFIARGVEGIIIVPVDDESVVVMIKEANEARIPVVLYSRAPVRNSARSVAVAADNYAIAKDTVEYLAQQAMKTGPKHKAVILLGKLSDPNAVRRRDGFEDALKAYPDIEVVGRIPTDWQQEKALAGLTNTLQAHPNIDLVFASSDLLLVSAVAVLKTTGRYHRIGELGHVFLAGLDGDANAHRMLLDRYLDAEGVQDVAFETEHSVQAVFDLKSGVHVPELIRDQGFVVHQGNLKELGPRMWGFTVNSQ